MMNIYLALHDYPNYTQTMSKIETIHELHRLDGARKWAYPLISLITLICLITLS